MNPVSRRQVLMPAELLNGRTVAGHWDCGDRCSLPLPATGCETSHPVYLGVFPSQLQRGGRWKEMTAVKVTATAGLRGDVRCCWGGGAVSGRGGRHLSVVLTAVTFTKGIGSPTNWPVPCGE